MKKILILSLSILAFACKIYSQEAEKAYIRPTDPKVLENIEQWQDLKFGIFMHWGTYSQWGVVESWSICPEDEGWTQRQGQYSKDYFEYKKAY